MLDGATEENVLTALCHNADACVQIAERVSPALFSTRGYKQIAEKAIEFVRKYGKPPGAHIRDELEDKLKGGSAEVKFFADTFNDMDRLKDSLHGQYVLDKLDGFIERVRMTQAIQKAADAAQAGDIDKAKKFMRDAFGPANGALGFTSFAELKPRGVDWVWKDRLPSGKLVMFVGDAGVGKSTLTCHIAAVISRAGSAKPLYWPDGSRAPRGRVLFLCSEDNPNDTILPRLMAAGANLSRVSIYKPSGAGGKEWTLDQHEKLEEFLTAAEEREEYYSLLVIDPISAYLPQGMEGNNDAEVRGMLRPLMELGERYGLTILGVKHPPKAAQKAVHSASGSTAWIAAARMAYTILKDPDDPERVLFLPIKTNLAARKPGLAYRLKTVPIDSGDAEIGILETSSVIWDAGTVSITADEALNGPSAKSQREGKTQDVINFLKEELADGPVRATVMEQRAAELGFAARTLRRARQDLGIKPYRRTGEANGPWMWSLPDNE